MKQHKNKGFTIVETMIFLAVSGMLFTSVAVMISGQMAKYQSRDAVNQVESVVRSVTNDVSNGYYPLVNKQYGCTAASPRPTVSPLGTTGENRGTHTGTTGCVIAGKSIEFLSDRVVIHTLIANFNQPGIPDLTGSDTQVTELTDLDEIKEYKWGLKFNGIKKLYALYTKYGADYDGSQFISGAQSIKLFETSGSNNIPVSSSNANNVICFENGPKNSSLIIEDNSLNIKADYNGTGCP